MRKFLTAALAALTLGGAMVATTAPAEAGPYGWRGGYGGWHGGYGGYNGYHYYGHHGSNAGVAVAAGIAGLAVGAALASPRSYDNGYYGGGYYAPGYAYPSSGYYYYPEPAYRLCSGGHWVWDPYAGRNIWVRERYYC
ncbi:MAG TPA: hypothetical protein VJS38_16405 [Phenylobacterium sp.]|uniref:hypothetical protein n=1 Tax=Phenylobacterium sp. TaxID=1871053 RepID=UPI002B46B13D|nr:hypothetical protein [Phenylobacterium sp.]HKR89754.1 hypothetical protein [Phenylobacterium sp.]